MDHPSFKCACARIAYRNNNDGTRDYKTIGKSSCRICRGSGWVAVCSECENAGMVNGKICVKCGGSGRVRREGP